jgi:uncharacterized protein (TIGR02611 family)
MAFTSLQNLFMKRAVKIAGGFLLLLAGLVMLVTPGPGWVTIALGLALLATEYRWARRLLDRLKARGVQLRDTIFGSRS